MATLKLKLNTQDGHSAFTTETITGSLKGIIIKSDWQVEVIIQSIEGYLIFHSREHIGTKYYSPGALVRAARQDLRQHDQFEEYSLDEELEIIIRGPKGRDIDFLIRYS